MIGHDVCMFRWFNFTRKCPVKEEELDFKELVALKKKDAKGGKVGIFNDDFRSVSSLDNESETQKKIMMGGRGLDDDVWKDRGLDDDETIKRTKNNVTSGQGINNETAKITPFRAKRRASRIASRIHNLQLEEPQKNLELSTRNRHALMMVSSPSKSRRRRNRRP